MRRRGRSHSERTQQPRENAISASASGQAPPPPARRSSKAGPASDRQRDFERAQTTCFAHAGAAPKSRWLHDRHRRLLHHLEIAGDGEPLVFVHGGGSNAGEWASLLPHLSGNRRCIVVDRPGHGLSYKLDYTHVPFRPAAVEYMTDLFDGLGTGRATLIANSMGGYFSLCFALAHPSRVRRLVLLGAPAGVDRWLPWPLRLLGWRGFNRLLFRAMRGATPEDLRTKLFGPLLVAHPERVPGEFLSLVVAANQLPGAECSWRTLLEKVATLRGFRQRLHIREDVARLPVPTTFIWGERDAFAPPASGRALARRMPHATVATIPDAGHLPRFDAPEPCAEAMERALRGD